MHKHGGDTFGMDKIEYDFSVNLSPLGLPKGAREALSELSLRKDLEGYPDTMQRELKERLSSKIGVDSEKIVFGNGAADLIYRLPVAIKKIVNWDIEDSPLSGLIPVPSFSEYEKALREGGFRVGFHEINEESSFQITDSLNDKISKERPNIIFLCNPGNPTGVILDNSSLKETALICERVGTYLILDECFLELTEDGDKDSLIPEIENYPHLIILRSFTKTYGMAGLRLGYAVCGDKALGETLMDTGQPWCVSKAAEVTGLKCLEDSSYIDEARRIISQERGRMLQALQGMNLKVIEGGANYILFFCDINLYDELIKRGILIRNCDNYRGLGPGWFRVAIKTREENEAFLWHIKNALVNS